MLAVGSEMFLLVPAESKQKRILHPGKVLESNDTHFVAEFEQAISPALESDVVAFGERNTKFFQQGAIVRELRLPGDKPVFMFERVGDAVSAEQRQIFRVSTVTSGIVALVGKEKGCRVVDISPEGFGTVCKTALELGSLVKVSFQYEHELLSTMARVQTAKQRHDGSYRYGFLAPDRNSDARKMLARLAGQFQRMQLRRLSGAA
jgi:hypothetical protein